jgi:hypothetical protein
MSCEFVFSGVLGGTEIISEWFFSLQAGIDQAFILLCSDLGCK